MCTCTLWPPGDRRTSPSSLSTPTTWTASKVKKKYQPQSNEHISTYKCKSMLILTDNGLTSDPKICDDLEDDQPDDLQTLTFDDLLSVSFQVAKGMEFLSSRNVRDPEQHSLYCTWFLRITSLVSSLD